MEPATGEKGPQIAESRVRLLSNLPLPEEHKRAGDALKKYGCVRWSGFSRPAGSSSSQNTVFLSRNNQPISAKF